MLGPVGVPAAAAIGPSAHLCTSDELLRSAATGLTMPRGWMSAAAWTYYSGLSFTDCRFSRSSTGCFSRMFVMGRTRFPGLGGALIGEGAVV